MSTKLGDDGDDLLGDIDKLVKRWNRKHGATIASAFEAYINGDIDLLFEYPACRDALHYPVIQCERLAGPREVPRVLCNAYAGTRRDTWQEVRNFLAHFTDVNLKVVPDRDQGRVFVGVIDGAHKVEELVASRFTVRFERQDSRMELWADLVGESISAGFVKSCCGFRKWKLNGLLFSGADGMRVNHCGVSVVNCGSQILDGVTTQNRKSIHYGFVAFGVRAAPTGFGIRLKDLTERSFFRENFGNISDVYRGPINLEASRLELICQRHREEPPEHEASAPR